MAESLKGMSDAALEKLMTTEGYWSDSLRFVRGKSLVGGTATGDVFENVSGEPIAFSRPEVAPEPQEPELSVELGGPWSFYAEFRRAHGLTHLPHPEPPEIALQVGTTLVIPLWVRNQTSSPQEITLICRTAERLDGAKRHGKILDCCKTNRGGALGSQFAGNYRWR